MQLNKFTNDLDGAPLHSSGYAEAARPSRIGAVSPQSFNQRLHIERNRQSVGKYHHSMIATGHHRNTHYQRTNTAVARPGNDILPATSTQQQSSPSARGVRPSSGRLISDVRPVRPSFNEPQRRTYNPYQ